MTGKSNQGRGLLVNILVNVFLDDTIQQTIKFNSEKEIFPPQIDWSFPKLLANGTPWKETFHSVTGCKYLKVDSPTRRE